MSTERQVMQGYLDAFVPAGPAFRPASPTMSSPLEGTDQTAVEWDRAGQLIRYVHENAFDARADVKNLLAGEGTAAIEADFAGTHTGEFAGSSLRAEPSACRIRFFTTYAAARSAGCGSPSRGAS